MDDPRRKTGSVTVDVSPTFISTDLLTPGSAHLRVTLPAIAKFSRPVQHSGRWGTVTVSNVTSTRVDVTHRHYGCGCFNFVAPYQPYQLTPLMLSRCRRNDQMLFSPEKGIMQFSNFIIHYLAGSMHDKQILLPFPQQDPNAAHVSKLSIFPNPFDSRNSTTTSTECERILKSLEQSLYCRTGYTDTYKAHHVTQYVKPPIPSLNKTATLILYQDAQDQVDCTSSEGLIDLKVKQKLIPVPDDDDNTDESNDRAEDTSNNNETMNQTVKSSHDKGTQTNKRDLLIDTTTSNTCILLLTTQRGCQTGTTSSYHHHQNSTVRLSNDDTIDISNTQSGGRKRPLMNDASTQTIVLMSLVRKTQHSSPPISSKYTKTFPILPSIQSIPHLESIVVGRKATKSLQHHPQQHCKLRPCYHNTDPVLTARFKAQLKYNKEFVECGSGSCENNNLCPPLSRKSAKKMSFYGEHTSIFR